MERKERWISRDSWLHYDEDLDDSVIRKVVVEKVKGRTPCYRSSISSSSQDDLTSADHYDLYLNFGESKTSKFDRENARSRKSGAKKMKLEPQTKTSFKKKSKSELEVSNISSPSASIPVSVTKPVRSNLEKRKKKRLKSRRSRGLLKLKSTLNTIKPFPPDTSTSSETETGTFNDPADIPDDTSSVWADLTYSCERLDIGRKSTPSPPKKKRRSGSVSTVWEELSLPGSENSDQNTTAEMLLNTNSPKPKKKWKKLLETHDSGDSFDWDDL